MPYGKNDTVRWLLSRSYGQGGTVALPHASASPSGEPRGKFPAGVEDVLNRLLDQYASWSDANSSGGDVEWCFLVGGPGNGKSEALRELAGALQVGLPNRIPGQPAPRVVPPDWPAAAAPLVPGLEIAFINDASIPRQSSAGRNSGSLFLDLLDGLGRLLRHESPVVLFGNVNRGILVEEDAAFQRRGHSQVVVSDEADRYAGQIIGWLLDPPRDSSRSPAMNKLRTVVPVQPTRPFYGQFRVPTKNLGADHDVVVHVVFLDTLSLLEPLPGETKAIDFTRTPPSVAEYRTYGGFTDDREAERDRTAAGGLLQSLIEITRWDDDGCLHSQERTKCRAFDLCPFSQNSRWLRDPNLQRRLLDLLRAGEIAAGRRLTYRDLLGHLSLALIGQPENSWLTGLHPCEWVRRKVESIEQQQSKSAIAELANHRVYAGLFPSTDPEAWRRAQVDARQDTIYSVAITGMASMLETVRDQAFVKAFNDIDPARDVEPWKDEARQEVLSAIESLDIDSPTRLLREKSVLPTGASSRIEELLDQATKDEILSELSGRTDRQSNKTADRRATLLRKWRYTLLCRQVGLALGEMTFKSALAAWLAEQENALKRTSPLDLQKGLEALLLPRTRAENLWLAPLRPRTYALDAKQLPVNTLLVAIDPDDLRLELVPQGDSLTAEVLQQQRGDRTPPRLIAALVVDLAIAREALLHSGEDATSFTEIDASAFARIERVRASLVGRRRLETGSTYFTDERGTPLSLADNPGRAVPLRVVRQK